MDVFKKSTQRNISYIVLTVMVVVFVTLAFERDRLSHTFLALSQSY